MKYRLTFCSFLMTTSMLTLAWQASGRTDYYTGAFYTRGTDMASYIDQGGSVLDPFYIPVQAWSLLPRLTLTASREDNVFLDSEDSTDATVINFIPGILFIYGRPDHNHLYADYGMIVPLYDSSDEIDNEPSHMLSLGGTYQTGKSQVYGRAGYRRLENVDTVEGARIIKHDYIGDLGLEHRVSSKSSVGAVGSAEFHDFEASQYTDYNRYYGGLRLFHRLTGKSEGFLQLGLGRDDLDTGPSNYGDADFYDVSLGLRGKQSPKLAISGRVGYMWRTYLVDEIDDTEHWIASIGAESNPFGLTTFTAELLADIRPAISAAGTSSVDQRFTLGANRRLFSERLRGNASIYVGQVDFEGPDDDATAVRDRDYVYNGRTDEYWGFSLGIDYWTKQNVSIGLGYSYIENKAYRDGSDEAQDRSSYEAGRWVARVSWNY